MDHLSCIENKFKVKLMYLGWHSNTQIYFIHKNQASVSKTRITRTVPIPICNIAPLNFP